jgi:hypothetical protein
VHVCVCGVCVCVVCVCGVPVCGVPVCGVPMWCVCVCGVCVCGVCVCVVCMCGVCVVCVCVVCVCVCGVCVKETDTFPYGPINFVTKSSRISNLLPKTKPENTEVNIIKQMYLFYYGLSVLKDEDITLPRHVGLRLSIHAASHPDERTYLALLRKS